MKWIGILALAGLTQVSTVGSAQDSATVARLSLKHATASRLRVTGAAGRLDLPYARITGSGVQYQRFSSSDSLGPSGTATVVVPWPDIQRIERRGNSAGRGAVIGGGTFMVLTMLSLLSNDCTAAEEMLCGVAAGAAALAIPVGTGVGALIGLAIPRWKSVYRRPASASSGDVAGGEAVFLQ
ncbi:MAG TPA: hypothetical protein VF252_10280 [Gemmatimonadales bacterium]